MMPAAKPNVVVVGGGFAGLEAAFYLRWRLGPDADLTLLSDSDRFVYKPDTIYIPFGLDPERVMIPLEHPMRRKGIVFAQAKVREIDPAARLVHTEERNFHYDYLVVATGAGMRPEEIPGLGVHAETIATPETMLKLRAAFARLLADAREGRRRRVLFLVPPNNKCAGPLYEMVFMLDTWLQRNRGRTAVDIAWSTYEATFMQTFGPRLHRMAVGEFGRRGISGYAGYAVDRVEHDAVFYRNGKSLPYDVLVSFPPYVAGSVFLGLPQDDRGFLRTNAVTRQVIDHPNIYAVGDAGDFPVKQGFLAFLQADAAAEHLGATILGAQPAFGFDPVTMCVMEEFDTATFAQVPLRLTGLPDQPIEVRPDANGTYRVGSSPAWRIGKKLLGVYLPWRFRSGNPFHAGLAWQGLDLGLSAMARVLAA